MNDVDNLTADSFDTDEIASAIEDAGAWNEPASTPRQGGGFWWLLLLLVIVFGYLSAARRASLGRFAEQVTDIIHDFRGYDPEF
ncbi:MAG: hypothetical protein ACR2JW_12835 [Thermomicrobiales bacterium]